jgi:REP element-mobilizing transposase RayT
MPNVPLAYFITWTVYGTFLPGDKRWWRHKRKGVSAPADGLAQWSKKRLLHPISLLAQDDQVACEFAIDEICVFRQWKLWARSARSNQVHVLVTATDKKPNLVRDQIKAKCTLEIRKANLEFVDRPIWTTGGDVEFIDTEDEIFQCQVYINDAQDRKERDA